MVNETGASLCVEQFIYAWNEMDFEKIIDHLHENIVYHNIPMPVLEGKLSVRNYLRKSWGIFQEINWRLINIAETGNIVLTERIDNFVINGATVSLPVMGTFEITDGRIIAWRDYFDLLPYRQQIENALNPSNPSE